MNENGSFTVEASMVVPVLIIFISIMLLLNMKVFAFVRDSCVEYEKCGLNYSDVHRAADVIFDTGGDLYEKFFG